MLHFISLGSGSSGNCYLLSYQDDNDLFGRRSTILIDAGISLRKIRASLGMYGYKMDDVDALLLTHDHSDHACYAPKMAVKHGLPVFATEKTFEGIAHNPTIKPNVPQGSRFVIEPDKSFNVGVFSIVAYPVSHDSWDCVAYRIEVGGKVFALITDCGELSPGLEGLIGECSYLVVESNHDVGMLRRGRYPLFLKSRILGVRGHLSNAACGLALRRNLSDKIEWVCLCHLSGENNTAECALGVVGGMVGSLLDGRLFVLPREGVFVPPRVPSRE